MTKAVYFFDSYAIIEIIKGNENYKEYTDSVILTTKLNLFEVFYSLLRDLNEKECSTFLERYIKFTIDFDKEIIKEAAKFKLQNKNLSMTDCIGYCLANKWGVKFLTGNREFGNLSNVEFIK